MSAVLVTSVRDSLARIGLPDCMLGEQLAFPEAR
jgi:hypothetical protein